MKKYLLLILGLLLPLTINASNEAVVNITTNSTIKKGNEITVKVEITSPKPIGYYEYTLDYNSSKLKLTKGSSYNVDKPNTNSTNKITKEFKFKVLEQDPGKISIKSYAVTTYSDQENLKVIVNSLKLSQKQSSNNYLSSLEVKNYKLNPDFNKNKENYSIDITNDIESLNIIAKTEDKNATISGDGNISINPKDKKTEITVTSQDGEERTYTINFNIEKKKKIEINIEGKKYKLLSELKGINKPDNYEEKKIVIEGEQITSLYNEKIDYTLVALQDEKNNISLFIYNENDKTYLPYEEIIINKISFIPIENSESFKDYKKTTLKLNELEITAYQKDTSNDYYIIYGINTKTGKKGWYSYNKEEESLQIYNEEYDNICDSQIKNSNTLIYILSAATLLFGLLIIILAIKLNNKNKR